MATRSITPGVAPEAALPPRSGAAGATPPLAPPMTRLTRISYGAGSIANGVKNVSFSAFLMFFYNQVVGVSAAVVSAALALTLLVDALIDPVIGRWSDEVRTRWGRRHPFIYAAAIPSAAFFLLVWFPPAGASEAQIGVWVFATAVATRMAISAFEINSQAMAAELTDDYTERTRLFSLRYWFLYIGQYGFSAVALLVFFAATPDYPRGQLNPASYTGFAVLGAVMIACAILVCGLGTHARIPMLRQADAIVPGQRGIGRHFREIGRAVRNRAFLALFGFGVLKFTAIGLYAASALYFNTYLFGLGAKELALLTLDSVVAATIAAPLAPMMSHWLGKRASSAIFAVAGAAIGMLPLVLAYYDLLFVAGDPRLLITLLVVGAVSGAMIAISLINTSSMMADVVEDSAVRTGRYDAGTFFAASSFMQQCSTALGLVVNGIILTWAGFPKKVSPADIAPGALDALIAHYVPIAMLLWALGCAFLLFYPIDRARHEANLAILRARHRAAAAGPDAG